MNNITPLANNGVSVDFDPHNCTDDELKDLMRLVQDKNLVLIRNVPHDEDKTTAFFDRIGRTYIRPQGLYFTDDDHVQITRVTNRRDDDGNKIGLFADLELGWHCNGTLRKDVKQTTLGLYCVSPGDRQYGITGFTNMHAAYNDMPLGIQELCDSMDIEVSFRAFTGEVSTLHDGDAGYKLKQDDPEYEIFSGKNVHERKVYTSDEGLYKPLVTTHPLTGQKSLYFIPSVITNWTSRSGRDFDSKMLWAYLMEHCYHSGEYGYFHTWSPGDLILNDQWTGMHNRTEVKGDRLMHRYCVDNKILDD